ncbi:MAG TPA: S-methyl-5-thioribose-1-phosphate isomerase [Syntrophorhabdales bacterium]|nr:S-methyl-5-thioribose-1-phosphate isomerase [Syntrophorhabdales bacterium]
MTEHIIWKDNQLHLLDQRRLPFKKVYVKCKTLQDVSKAIKNMTIRGAPLIGIVAAYGMYLGVRQVSRSRKIVKESDVAQVYQRLQATRPTAVNLTWALDRMRDVYRQYKDSDDLLEFLLQAAVAIHVEDIENNRRMGQYGAELIDDGDLILTHCNAGSLATGGYGTALGVIRAAHESGKRIRVIATETRPYLQGARLTAWELHEDGIDVEIVPDNHVGLLCAHGIVTKVIVGADRIARNGDVANKVGTYLVALAAHEHAIPFYVAAPLSTFDRTVKSGQQIVIEERSGKEVTCLLGRQLTLKQIKGCYYGFDITPARLITYIITENGLLEKPFSKYITLLFTGKREGHNAAH